MREIGAFAGVSRQILNFPSVIGKFILLLVLTVLTIVLKVNERVENLILFHNTELRSHCTAVADPESNPAKSNSKCVNKVLYFVGYLTISPP